ncbi:FecR family protein [Butyricimonas faecihominis]|jgi:transmembrane sensor
MEKTKLDHETEDWLIAFLSGELDEREEENVRVWLEASQENQNAYESLMKDYLRIRWVQENVHIREEQAKKIIFSSLKKKRNLTPYYGVAASIAVLLIVTLFFFIREDKQGVSEKLVTSEIKPIQSRALLVLSTGEQIQLTKSAQEIQEQDGSVLKIDSVMGVQYDSLSTKRAEKPIYNKIVVPRGGEYFVTLSEGTKVWLDADSELEYPVFFSGDFREVKLKGNAYFSVTKKNDKPFVVRAGEFSLKVYGTEFNVNAYDLQNIETVLVNGSIGFKANVSTPERMMEPNELAVSDSRTGLSEIHQVDIYPYIAWKNQNIVFVNERLESIMEKMARWYDVTVFFQDESLKDLRFDCNMRRYTDIRDLFFFLEKTSNARFALNGRTVVISKK